MGVGKMTNDECRMTNGWTADFEQEGAKGAEDGSMANVNYSELVEMRPVSAGQLMTSSKASAIFWGMLVRHPLIGKKLISGRPAKGVRAMGRSRQLSGVKSRVGMFSVHMYTLS
jgi:hypothetical protein